MSDAFLDASYAIALSASSDQYHERAVLIASRLETEGTRLVTTRGVVLEIGNALSRKRYRMAAVSLLRAIEVDPNIDVVPLSEPLYQEALELYERRPDKEWGLTDCLSFVVMRHRGLTDALTADDHFRQAGFRALLLEQ